MQTPHHFSPIIHAFWQQEFNECQHLIDHETFGLYVNRTLDKDFLAIRLKQIHHIAVSCGEPLAQAIKEASLTNIDEAVLNHYLNKAGLRWFGENHIFYYEQAEKEMLLQRRLSPQTRQLTVKDLPLFTEFSTHLSEEELHNAAVNIQHWLVYGIFAANKLVAVASMYPWSKELTSYGALIADLGVMTLPDYRQKGYARHLVRAISQQAILLGYEPQYRCRYHSKAAMKLALAAGFVPFGRWDVILANKKSRQS